MSLSDDDPLSPTEKNQEQRESPQDTSFLSFNETEATYLPPMNRDQEVFPSIDWGFPNYQNSDNIAMNMFDPSCGMIGGSLDSAVNMASQIASTYIAAPESQISVGMQQQMSNSSLDEDGVDLGQWFTNSTGNSESAYSNLHQLGMQSAGFDRKSSDPFGYQHNFYLYPLGSIESMIKAKEDRERINMIPTPGHVNSNNDQSYLTDEASLLSNSNELLHKPGSQMGIGVRPGMQQTISNVSNSFINGGVGMNAESVDLCTSFTSSTTISQRSGMQGEGYGTNNPDSFGDISNPFLGSGENIASMSSQRDDFRPGKQQKMSYVSNSSISGDVGMYTRMSQEAYDNLQRAGMTGEIYGTNNPVSFEDQMNIASMSSQRNNLRPEMQQKMSNVSNSSMSAGVGMYTKNIDSGEGYGTNNSDPLGYQRNFFPDSAWNIASMSSQRDKNQNVNISTNGNRNDDQSYLSVEAFNNSGNLNNPATSASFKSVSSTSSPLQQSEWTTKILSSTDVNGSSGVLLKRSFVEQHIKKNLPEADQNKFGIDINLYDHDTKTTHKLWLAFRRDFFLTCGWKDIVDNKNLRVGDVIGFFWDSSNSTLHFSLLKRATAEAPAEEKKIVNQAISGKGQGT